MNIFNKAKKNDGKELYDNFDYLVSQIKEEWLQSKESKKKVLIKKNDVDIFFEDIMKMNGVIKSMLENEHNELMFQEYMGLVKQNCIVIRIAKKIAAALKVAKGKAVLAVDFDKEEYKFFVECYPEYK